jgi:thioredoxin
MPRKTATPEPRPTPSSPSTTLGGVPLPQPILRLVDEGALPISEAAAHCHVLVVDCWADWCGPCKDMGRTIKKLAVEMAGQGVVFGKLDIDAEEDAARKYKIGSIPTLLVFLDGKLLDGEDDRIIGAEPKTVLRSRIEGIVAGGVLAEVKKKAAEQKKAAADLAAAELEKKALKKGKGKK